MHAFKRPCELAMRHLSMLVSTSGSMLTEAPTLAREPKHRGTQPGFQQIALPSQPARSDVAWTPAGHCHTWGPPTPGVTPASPAGSRGPGRICRRSPPRSPADPPTATAAAPTPPETSPRPRPCRRAPPPLSTRPIRPASPSLLDPIQPVSSRIDSRSVRAAECAKGAGFWFEVP